MSTTKQGYLLTEVGRDTYREIREMISGLEEYFPEAREEFLRDTTSNQQNSNYLLMKIGDELIEELHLDYDQRPGPRYANYPPKKLYGTEKGKEYIITFSELDNNLDKDQIQLLLHDNYLEPYVTALETFLEEVKTMGIYKAIFEAINREEMDYLITEIQEHEEYGNDDPYNIFKESFVNHLIKVTDNVTMLSELISIELITKDHY